MASLLTILTALSTISAATAQSCWRNTTCTGPTTAAFPGPWESNIYSPASRTVHPANVLSLGNASIISPYPGVSRLSSNGSALVFDFGIEVGGIVNVNYTTTGGSGSLGLAFTEAKNWIGLASDSSNGDFGSSNASLRQNGDQVCNDGALYSYFSGAGSHSYTMDLQHLRGGFRYLTLFLLTGDAGTTLNIDGVSLEIGFQPTWSNLRAYQGYFHSNDEELNKIWYSGAYTLQTNNVPVNTGRWIPALAASWANNGTLSNGSTVIVDGAKRDRAVWPGDMGIAVPSTFVSVGDLQSVQNALQTMYDHQNSDGSFPEAGPPLLQQGSDTYHMWTMIGTYNYVLFTNDTTFLAHNWASYQHAMEYIYAKVLQPLGLLSVTGTRDWARVQQGGNNTEANMILYRTLITGAELAAWSGNSSLASTYTARAATLASNIIQYTYVDSYGAFKDNNTNTTLYPQDANSMALLFGVVSDTSTMAQNISLRLTDNWTPIGAETPELPNNISPFISSFEIQGHLTIGQTDRALDLIRRSWGWYLNNPNGSQSTVIEGYLTNGSFGYRNYRGYNYDSSYVSHSHGWSSGPTSALTNFVLGLQVTGRAGSTWRFAPQFGDLTSVQGGFTTILGKFQASWNVTGGGYVVELSVPQGTTGEVVLPPMPTSVPSSVLSSVPTSVPTSVHSSVPSSGGVGGNNVMWNGQHYGQMSGGAFQVACDGGRHSFSVW
ncbi:glycoside hydrolase family 78 protein [Baudoinia panamericana UAMH 10762]|uniref:Glycoside hydrolase family 78 protein n=1 Tax=Baudoinia panamericana (strain UAMH 10762) TaxID=717646 RepID=M2LRD9_BAUPA|nr:glycoside hydrolase family 78 protein [Baudoinia panamericana UAMH 10762]EMC96992.1 glycoside hydrolase family 78 protein [Baudoinia panamericana UAMH 10762]